MKRYINSSEYYHTEHPAIAKAHLSPKIIAKLGEFHKRRDFGVNVSIELEAYLQGLEDAGVITFDEHFEISNEVMR